MFDKRIEKLRKSLLKEKLEGMLVSSVSNISYFSGYSNFSKDEREAYIFIGESFAYIITDGRYAEAVKNQTPHLTLFQRGGEIKLQKLFKKHPLKTLGIEEGNLTISEHKTLKKHFKKIKNFSFSRAVKAKEEIEKIEKACKLGDQAFQHALSYIKAGIIEKELAFEIEIFVKRNGAELSFPTIVAFGKNSSVPHHQTGQTVLENNQFVLIDMGVKLEDYCSDMTRTIFFGKATQKHRKIYEVVLAAQQKAVKSVKDGVKAKKVDEVARKYITSAGFSSIPHSVGHGVGLDVHEDPHLSPKSKDILKEGMVFSIEPGIYIPNFGGVRIEDLFVLEKDGLKQITTSTKNLIEL